MLWVQWKTRRRRFHELRRAGVGEKATYAAIMSCKGPWRLSASEALHRALRNQTFAKEGLVFMDALFHARIAARGQFVRDLLGMPSMRSPPSGLGILTRLTGCGR